ncbi:MAG TPA: hypothetical protein VF077_10960 [Nitrospiraceae bacterium]
MATSPAYFGSFSDQEQPTYNTVAGYIADARTLLEDKVPPYRYDDPSLLVALNATMLEARRVRPDLFVFNLFYKGQVPAYAAVDDTYVAIEPPFRLAVLHGLCAHALERDQEDVQDSRAQSLMNQFNAGLIGRALPGPQGGSAPGGQQR